VGETVSVKSFKPGNDWTSEDGKIALTFYECVFDRAGSEFTATWNKKQGTGDPPIGEPIEGEFTEKKPGDWRFRKASKPQGGGGEFKGGGGKSPDQQASIVRQHSQEMSLRALEIFTTAEWREDDLKAAIIKWTDFFAADAEAAQAASGAETSPPEPPAPSQATHQELHGLLEKAGMNSNASRVVTDYVITNMSAEEQDAALSMLANPDRATAAVKRLSEKAEAHYGSPLPSGDADSEIPFRRPEYVELFSVRERRSNR
jgi:hypothetical protein